MIPVDIIEEEFYTFFELSQKFDYNEDDTVNILKKLNEYGILRSIDLSKKDLDLSDLQSNDIEIVGVEKEDYGYVFEYVGLIIISNLVIKCYPKYLKNNSNPQKELKQIIRVLEKYNNSKEQIFKLQKELDVNSNFNMLSIMIYFLEDYFENGVYTNSQNIVEINGSGEILWDKTINETYALIQNNRPYYLDLYTKKTVDDNEDYFKLLHEVILTKCSKELAKADILNLFDLTPVNLNNTELIDFGDEEYIKSRILKELNVQFNSHKQSLLKAMYAFIGHSDSYLGDINYFNVYGTNAYYSVWEEMCANVLDNKLNSVLYNLELPSKDIHNKYNKNQTLFSVIERHIWYLLDEFGNYDNVRGESLIPDLITLNKDQFIIFDAKYYNFPLKKPGVSDITKQYLYELAYKEFMELHDFTSCKNCFLFPIDGDEIINKGYVELKMLKNLELENIQVRLLPAKIINKLYLENKKLDFSKLEL